MVFPVVRRLCVTPSIMDAPESRETVESSMKTRDNDTAVTFLSAQHEK